MKSVGSSWHRTFSRKKSKKRWQLFFWFRLLACLSGVACPQSVGRGAFTEKILINKPQRDPVCPGEPAGSHGERGAVWRTLCSRENCVGVGDPGTPADLRGTWEPSLRLSLGQIHFFSVCGLTESGSRAHPAEFLSRVKQLTDSLNFSLSIFILKNRWAITARLQKKVPGPWETFTIGRKRVPGLPRCQA